MPPCSAEAVMVWGLRRSSPVPIDGCRVAGGLRMPGSVGAPTLRSRHPARAPPPGLCVGFNVDVRRPRLFHGPAEAQFGYKVLQRVGGGEKW